MNSTQRTYAGLFLALVPLLVAACGQSSLLASAATRAPAKVGTLATPTLHGASPVPQFNDVSVADLAAHAEDAAYEGKFVRIDASFERYTYAQEYGRTFHGYRLWDHSGQWVLCQNIYSVTTVYPGAVPDTSRDLDATAITRLLSYGTFVRLEGQFHTSVSAPSHGGVFTVPPSVDIYTIDGQQTHAFVNS